jgi:hypothetical protein
MKIKIALFLIVILCTFETPARMHKCINSNGHTSYSDSSCKQGQTDSTDNALQKGVDHFALPENEEWFEKEAAIVAARKERNDRLEAIRLRSDASRQPYIDQGLVEQNNRIAAQDNEGYQNNNQPQYQDAIDNELRKPFKNTRFIRSLLNAQQGTSNSNTGMQDQMEDQRNQMINQRVQMENQRIQNEIKSQQMKVEMDSMKNQQRREEMFQNLR